MWAHAASRRTRLALIVLAVAGLLAGCTRGATPASNPGPAPDQTIQQFAADWSAGKIADAAALTSQPDEAAQLLTQVASDLQATKVTVGTGSVTHGADGAATVTASVTWTLPIAGTWTYTVPWTWTESGTGSNASWTLNWSPADINPQLGAQQTMAVRSLPATAGTIVDRNDVQLIAPVLVYAVNIDLAAVHDVAATATALAPLLSPIDNTVTVASIEAGVTAAHKAKQDSYTVINLRESDYDPIRVKLAAIQGLAIPSSQRNLPPTKDFAKVLLSEVTPVAQQMTVGTAGWEIVSVDTAGDVLTTLASKPAVPGAKVMLTIDTATQEAAEKALASQTLPSVIVAIQPSTGQILAVAQNSAANAQGAIALTGQYPPGSTFKIITGTAAFDAGIVTPTSPVDCPGGITIGGQTVHNENSFDLGVITVAEAFAHSCNTSFAHLASLLPDDALPTTATQYGVGLDFTIPGITVLNGSVPAPSTLSQRAEDGFGQGTDLVTPFAEALMAATAATGNMPLPTLIEGTKTTVNTPAPPRSAKAQADIRTLMRAVVTEGTAQNLKADGTVYAKTGTAEYVDSTGQIQAHAWTVGFRGDMAFAALIVGGNSSTNTNVLVDKFLKLLPAGE